VKKYNCIRAIQSKRLPDLLHYFGIVYDSRITTAQTRNMDFALCENCKKYINYEKKKHHENMQTYFRYELRICFSYLLTTTWQISSNFHLVVQVDQPKLQLFDTETAKPANLQRFVTVTDYFMTTPIFHQTTLVTILC